MPSLPANYDQRSLNLEAVVLIERATKLLKRAAAKLQESEWAPSTHRFAEEAEHLANRIKEYSR